MKSCCIAKPHGRITAEMARVNSSLVFACIVLDQSKQGMIVWLSTFDRTAFALWFTVICLVVASHVGRLSRKRVGEFRFAEPRHE